jgi:GPI mannosyltransferase 3
MVVPVDTSSNAAVDTQGRERTSSIRQRWHDQELTRKDKIVALLAVLALALFLRLAFFHFSPSIYWADEIYQSQEPAHRLAYGPGVVTWEYRLGVRSWVLPALIAAIMKGTAWIGPGSSGYVFGTALFFALVSLTVVWFAFSWCQTYFGIEYAALAAFSTAIWFELINFGPRALNELLAGNLFLPAIYLGSLPPDHPKVENKWRLMLVGVLLGLTACLRIQYAPAVLVAGLWILLRNWKARLLPVAAGVVAVVAIFGLVDAMTWSFPFYSYWAYFRENIIHHKAAGFGILPWYYYFVSLFVHTGPLAVLALIGVRRSAILGWISLAILVPHSLIAHKEFRYIYPVLPILLVLAAIGQVDFLQFIGRKMHGRLSPENTFLIASSVVLICSLALASRFPRWQKARGGLRAFSLLSTDEGACGLAVLGVDWWDTGGYTYLHRPIPIFFPPGSRAAAAVSPSFNRLVAPQSHALPLPGYEVSSCQDGVCVYHRDGPCQAGGSEFEVNEYLKRLDK